jgi:hypothetical protein
LTKASVSFSMVSLITFSLSDLLIVLTLS